MSFTLCIKDFSGLLNGKNSIETKASNTLELVEDIIKASGNKELKVSDIKILSQGKIVEISENNNNIGDFQNQTALTILRNK